MTIYFYMKKWEDIDLDRLQEKAYQEELYLFITKKTGIKFKAFNDEEVINDAFISFINQKTPEITKKGSISSYFYLILERKMISKYKYMNKRNKMHCNAEIPEYYTTPVDDEKSENELLLEIIRKNLSKEENRFLDKYTSLKRNKTSVEKVRYHRLIKKIQSKLSFYKSQL